MKTSCFFTYKGPGRISIARYAPRAIKGHAIYSALAPRGDMLKMPYEQYRPLYFDILDALDPAKVVETLTLLAGEHEPVLLCWERPPLTATNFCHRAMVSEWLERELGLKVREI